MIAATAVKAVKGYDSRAGRQHHHPRLANYPRYRSTLQNPPNKETTTRVKFSLIRKMLEPTNLKGTKTILHEIQKLQLGLLYGLASFLKLVEGQ